MSSGSEKESVFLLLDVRCLHKLRIQLHIERMLRVVKDGSDLIRQKWLLDRVLIHTESACFGSEIHLEASLCEYLVWIERFTVEKTSALSISVEDAVVAGNRDNRFAGNRICHKPSLLFPQMIACSAVTRVRFF